jgi:hypothetical protein
VSVAAGWTVQVGAPITASIPDPPPPGGVPGGYTLGARIEVPYTRAIVSYWQAATLSGGQWTVTLDGVAEPGSYLFVWMSSDADPPEVEVFLPIDVAAGAAPPAEGGLWPVYGTDWPTVDVEQITPTVDEVARLERTRTVDSAGNEYDTFNDQTRPTAQEVEGIIGDSVDSVLATLPPAFDPARYGQCRRVVALLAAMTIEGSYFKEQSLPNMPVRWQPEYTAERERLEESITEDTAQNNLLGAMEPRVSPPAPAPTRLT